MAIFILVHGAFHGGAGARRSCTCVPAATTSTYDAPIRRLSTCAGFYERTSKVPGWQVMELATGHDAMVMEPEALAQILADWAGG